MENIGFFERITRVFGMFFSSSFFIALLFIGIITVITFIIYNRIDSNKRPFLRIGFCFVYIGLVIVILIRYGSGIVLIGDAFIEKLFTAIYFPNIISYVCMLVISMLIMGYTIFNKKLNNTFRLCNLFSFIIIGLLTILIIDCISNYDINIYEKVSVYSNRDVMILIQASMGIFTIWLSILVVSFIINFITRKIAYSDESYIDVNVEEILPYTEEEYINYINYTKRKKYQEYLEDILK